MDLLNQIGFDNIDISKGLEKLDEKVNLEPGQLQNLRGTVLGGIEHAIISILDYRELETEEEENEVKKENDFSMSKIKKFAKDATKKIEEVKANLDNIRNQVDTLSTMLMSTTKRDELLDSAKSFEVQFNPISLSFNVSLHNKEQKKDVDGQHNQVEDGSKESDVTLSVDLYMDSEVSLLKKKLSVQERVEGLMSAISNSLTRYVIFSWGDMSYQGIATSLSATYTMFDVNGNPIKANLHFDMKCMDLTGQNGYSKERPFGIWQEAYERFIKPQKKQEQKSHLQSFSEFFKFDE